MGRFVYHAVPYEMVGDVLYPLTDLERVAPEAYESQRGKYGGRESVLDARINTEGLLFNGTVHCAPLHPHRLFAARHDMGFETAPPAASGNAKRPFGALFFEIPVERIVVHPTWWYRWQTPWINGYPGEDLPASPPHEEFEAFDVGRYRELDEVPAAHLAYLTRMKGEGRRPLTFVHIPHVLVAGSINVSGLRVVDWQQPLTVV